MMRVLATICITTVILGSSFKQQGTTRTLEVVGIPIAFEQSPWRKSNLSLEKREILILRVSRIIDGFEESRFLRVIYEYENADDALPNEMLTHQKEWHFSLKRTEACDASISDSYPKSKREDVIAGDDDALVYLVPIEEADVELPIDAVLPCYRLSTKAFAVLSKIVGRNLSGDTSPNH